MSKATYSPETSQLLEMLGARPIAYHPAFARAFGVKAAILLGQLLYWHGKQADGDGWIRKTTKEMNEETALSEREQETARATLIAANIIEYRMKGQPGMPHYRINHDAILAAVLHPETAELGRTKRPSKEEQKREASKDVYRGGLLGQNVLAYTEITTEITSETTARERGGASRRTPPRTQRAQVEAPSHLKNQPSANHKRPTWMGPVEPDARITAWQMFTTNAPLNKIQEDEIKARVTDCALWEAILRKAMLYHSKPNLARFLDYYKSGDVPVFEYGNGRTTIIGGNGSTKRNVAPNGVMLYVPEEDEEAQAQCQR